MQIHNFIVSGDFSNQRIDKFITYSLPEISRTQVQKAIKNKQVYLNQWHVCDADIKLRENDVIEVHIVPNIVSPDLQPLDMELSIVFEDDDLIVLNKPHGLTVHPGAGNYQNTLVNALIHHTKTLSDLSDATRPGIVHRLDKDTSGLMIVAKTNYAHNVIAKQIEERTMVRQYKALAWGMLNPTSGVIDMNITRSRADRTKMTTVQIGGKTAITNYETENLFAGGLISLVRCKLNTGRTHQIRVHLSHVGHSVVGDQVYGHNQRKISTCKDIELRTILSEFKRQALHSYYIEFTHPKTSERMSFEVELAEDMQRLVNYMQAM